MVYVLNHGQIYKLVNLELRLIAGSHFYLQLKVGNYRTTTSSSVILFQLYSYFTSCLILLILREQKKISLILCHRQQLFDRRADLSHRIEKLKLDGISIQEISYHICELINENQTIFPRYVIEKAISLLMNFKISLDSLINSDHLNSMC